MALSDYLLKTYPDCVFTISDDSIDSLVWDENNKTKKPTVEELTLNLNWQPPAKTQEEIDAYYAAQVALAAQTQYRYDRQSAYPSFAEQFDLLYHGGFDAWKSKIDEIKNKYPKP